MAADMQALQLVLQLGHACLWGSLLIAGLGVFCRVAPRLPASVRAWLWWLACAKLLLGLWVAAPINLPLLPALTPRVQTASATASAPLAPARLPLKHLASATLPTVPISPTPASQVPQTPRWPLCVLAVWLLGVAASLSFSVRQSWTARRLQHGASPASLLHTNLEALARQMGLWRVPRVLAGPNVQAPCIIGWIRPIILLPLDFGTLTPTELRLTLAHELAHLKRSDLPLASVPALARTLFFFNPLVWWAAAEWAAAREEACDALALTTTSLPRADYGRLLLKLAAPAVLPPALGLSPGYHNLRRRLRSLAHARQAPRGARLLVLVLPLLLPWRLSAALPRGEFRSGNASATRYTVIALANDSEVSALNTAGQVALSVREDSGAQGYAGNAGALAATDALPKHHATLAYGINDLGQVAGASFNIPGHARAFFWDGATHKIGSLPGYPYSEARAVNASGQVAGFAEVGHADRRRAWITRAFLRRPGEPLTDLGTLGGSYSAAYAVNQAGTVAGKADTELLGATHAFTWTDGQMTDLGTLGGANSVAYAISDTGQIAGASEIDATGTRHAFLYADGQMQDLVPLPAMTSSMAYAVSSSGQAVGMSQTASVKHATLWQNGKPADLNTLLQSGSGWLLAEAHAVNDHGQIAGIGFFHGHQAAFLLTPIPHS